MGTMLRKTIEQCWDKLDLASDDQLLKLDSEDNGNNREIVNFI